MINTPRLMLIPATVALTHAEFNNRGELARLLDSVVPDNWPPENVSDALPEFLAWLEAAPDKVGWVNWYALAHLSDGGPPVLIGCGGFLGPPCDGAVQIGFSMLPQFQRQGYATEMVQGLVRWAFGQPGVVRIMAETEWANPASVRVLEKAGFVPVGPATELEGTRFELLGEPGH